MQNRFELAKVNSFIGKDFNLLDIMATAAHVFSKRPESKENIFNIPTDQTKILAIDASIAHTSYTIGCVDLTNNPIYNGAYNLESEWSDYCENLKGLIDSRIFINIYHLIAILGELRPNCIALENYSYNSKFSGVDLAEQGSFIRAVVAMYAEFFSCQIFTYAPTEIKKSFAGVGNASKSLMQGNCTLVFQEPVLNDNDADSFAIFITCLVKEFDIPFSAKKLRVERIPLYKTFAKKGKALQIKNEGLLYPPKKAMEEVRG